jgi:hypothetical protein
VGEAGGKARDARGSAKSTMILTLGILRHSDCTVGIIKPGALLGRWKLRRCRVKSRMDFCRDVGVIDRARRSVSTMFGLTESKGYARLGPLVAVISIC